MQLKLFFFSAILSISVFSFLNAQQFGGNASSLKWRQINTPSVRVIFTMGLEEKAKRIADVAAALQTHTLNTIGGNTHKINIVLQSQTIIANAYVGLAPYRSEFYMTPDQDNFSLGSLNWTDNLIIHEYRHVQQYNNFNKGFTKLFGFVLGQEGRALANGITVPDWFFEGDAVFQETLVSEQGRGRMPSFLNEVKSLWQQNKNYSWMKLRNGSLRSLVPNHYPLGYQLVAYGYQQYGNEFWKKVTEDAVKFKGLFYSFNNSIAQHSGKTYKAFREDALNYFKALSLNRKARATVPLNFITPVQKNNIVSYNFPYTDGNKIITLKHSYKQIPSFIMLNDESEHKIRVKDLAIDDYYSCSNGKIVYSAYNNDARWGYKEYSDIRILDIHSGSQTKLTSKTKYFSPDISADGSLVLAIEVSPNGNNEVHLINANTGAVEKKLPNLNNYFFTQTKFLNGNQFAVSAVRDEAGKMALVKLNLANGETETITPFSYNVLGYPSVKGDTVFFSRMDKNADKLFAVQLSNKKIFRLTNNENAFYQPVINNKGDLIFTAFTADGSRLAKINAADINWQETDNEEINGVKDFYAADALNNSSAKILNGIPKGNYAITKYKQTTRLFNFHSWRPYVSEPEYGLTFYGDNVLNTFSSNLYYIYNTNETSHTIGYSGAFGGWYPLITAGVEGGFNRQYRVLFPNNTIETRYFNSADLFAGLSLPLQFTNGRTSKNITMGITYNLEQRKEAFPGKEIFSNRSFDFLRSFFSFSNVSQQARQHILPRWAQTFSINYRDAINFHDNHKLVATASLVFPGLGVNHNIVLNGAYQRRDTLSDYFSNTFPFSRGYEARNSQTMYRFGFNYHFPIAYPDWGFANLVYFMRIRGNAFFDYTRTQLKRQSGLLFKEYRTVGGELYFDSKIWNQLPLSIGVRYSHLLNGDALQPGVKGVWEIILPINLIPN